jgi:hypothetical protein
MILPPVTMVMTLYIPPIEGGFGRLQVAKQTIMSWGRYLNYAGELRLHIADDTVRGFECTEELLQFSPWPTSISHTQGKGLGGALNEGARQALEVSPLFIYADDSYSLRDPLNLTSWARILTEFGEPVNGQKGIGAISLMPPRPEQRGGQVIEFGVETESVRAIRFERQGYTWNGRPFLYHRRFVEHYGVFPEGVSGYEWERIYAERYVESPDGPEALQAIHDPWLHIWTVRLGDKPAGWEGT